MAEQAELSSPRGLQTQPDNHPRWWRRIGFWRAVAGMAAAAALAALIVLAEFSQLLVHRTHHFTNRLAAMNETVRQLKRRIMTAERRNVSAAESASADEMLKRVVAAPDLRTVKLVAVVAGKKSDSPTPAASGTLAISDTQKMAVLQITGMAPAAPNQVYRVWWQPKRGPEALAAEFIPDSTGKATVPIQPPPGNASIVMITCETGTDAARPTGAVVLKGKIAPEQSR